MHGEADDGLPTTESQSSLRALGRVLALRWVYPAGNLLTLLASSPLVLGRAPSSGTRLDSASVSRQHAELRLGAGAPLLVDLESRNGVFVNGERVKESPLRDGDVVRLGDFIAVVEPVMLDGLAGFRDLGHGIFGGSLLLRAVEQVRQAALAGGDILLAGETGTGKELLARAYHRFARREGAFVVFDCAFGDEATRAHELFGRSECDLLPGEHASIGQVRAAERGTLLVDALLDLPDELQVKFFELLAGRELVPFGGGQSVPVDVRFVATSSLAFDEPPAELRFSNHFKAVIQTPPLRARRSDIVPLFSHLLARHGMKDRVTLAPKLAESLCLYDWPLNVHELDSVARRMAARTAQGDLSVDDFLDMVAPRSAMPQRATPAPSPASRRLTPSYAPSQLAALRAALERHAGNLTKAASELSITRSKAYRMLKMAEDE